MSCCRAAADACEEAARAPGDPGPPARRAAREEVLAASRDLGGGTIETHFSVPAIHCGGCIRAIETAMGALGAVQDARVNLSTKRLSVTWRRDAADPDAVFAALERLGYDAHPIDAAADDGDPTLKRLILQLGVAGFAAGNIMLLSVSVWSGAEGSTRDLFHWISALIAVPAVAFSGQAFFRPAVAALRRGRMNMDVPISLAIVLAVVVSLYETSQSGPHAYFDASVTLLFFLLIGRTFDHVMRERARSAAAGLQRMAPRGATVVTADGARIWRPLDAIRAGERLFVAAGERIPLDARVIEGAGDVDAAIATGESDPVAVGPGVELPAGALNLSGALTLEATKPASQSFLAEMMAMLETAESAKPRFRRYADRAASFYSPIVHLAAFATFMGWGLIEGDWYRALYIAISVLIITCPCALALAVPVVQVVAAGRLFRHGVLLKDGAALETLARVDRVLFDKTGTLTVGRPRLLDADGHDAATLSLAGALARNSLHPYSQALTQAAARLQERPSAPALSAIRETPGCGLEARLGDGALLRLGRPAWALDDPSADQAGVALAQDGALLGLYRFEDAPRAGAAGTLAWLDAEGFEPEIISGDHPSRVAETARTLGADRWRGGLQPADKIARIQALQQDGHRVLMVGDGVNDAPALSAADASIAPATAADVGRRAAGFVFLHESLDAVVRALDVARRARALILQNFGLAVVYNMIAVPIAVMGYVTPLVAAIAMSSSSIVVISNALRLNLGAGRMTRALDRQARRAPGAGARAIKTAPAERADARSAGTA
ncbi:MAG: heavy metal translocating P-type ATPase [Marivibrio sp.]|uniref:heavy metal translocating P-type ATPase n=1 Tax=Marivibrio sp. TaxID=2039719 RepID=UPI0032F029F8